MSPTQNNRAASDTACHERWRSCHPVQCVLIVIKAMSGPEGEPVPLTVAVDDLGAGLWGGRLKQVSLVVRHHQRSATDQGWQGQQPTSAATALLQELEARVPLRNVPFSLSRAVVSVEELPVRWVCHLQGDRDTCARSAAAAAATRPPRLQSYTCCVHCSAHLPFCCLPRPACRYLDGRSGAQLQRLRQLAHSPVAWFRSPLVQVILVSCLEYEDYKRDLRLRLKAMADTETAAPGQPELLFVYLRPAAADAAAKGPARVFDTMRRDLTRRRERCVRLDPDPEAGACCACCACCVCFFGRRWQPAAAAERDMRCLTGAVCHHAAALLMSLPGCSPASAPTRICTRRSDRH